MDETVCPFFSFDFFQFGKFTKNRENREETKLSFEISMMFTWMAVTNSWKIFRRMDLEKDQK
jgi:hypothetical protein